jgi:adenylate kinase family enzyme
MGDNNHRTILLIGRTGNGKSTLANALANRTDLFRESDDSISCTKEHQTEQVVVDGLTLKVNRSVWYTNMTFSIDSRYNWNW